MNDATKQWHDEHVNFSRLLSALERQVSNFHGGEEPDYDLMVDIVEYLRDYADTYHHPREDVAFERLLAYEPRMKAQVNRLLQEHRVIAASGEELLMRLREVVAGAVIPRHLVETAAATYLVYYRHHITTEERDILPRAAQVLTADDWAAVADVAPPGSDPLFGDSPQARFQELRREIAAAAKLG
jgi:hemerythrin-like domain-containing protein